MKDPNWRKCVLCADSRDVIKRIPDNSIDFILTDPPYNLGQHSTGNIPLPERSAMNNDVAEWDMIDFNPEEWADEFIRILKPTGNLFIFTSYNQLGRWYNCLDHKFDTSNFMIWHKTNPAPKIFKAGFLNSCEMIFTCWNKKHTWNFISQAEMHNFIESPVCMRPERLSDPKHPAQKPVSILKKMMEIASNKDDIIFDPFMGVGSTGVAAMELGRKFIGVELDKTYCEAGRKRIDDALMHVTSNQNMISKKYNLPKDGQNNMVCEDNPVYQPTLFDIEELFCSGKSGQTLGACVPTGLQPIIKWAGGKEKELKFIIPNTPHFKNYYEPFVGGGSVFAAFRAEHYFINDKSNELISLYRSIATNDNAFHTWMIRVMDAWDAMLAHVKSHPELVAWYMLLRDGEISEEEMCSRMRTHIKDAHESLSLVVKEFPWHDKAYWKELDKNLTRKTLRMHKIEQEKQRMPDSDIYDNIETSFMSALYMFFRTLYNDKELMASDNALATAMFVFIRNYSYSGMFRYNDKGEFNVPYGGIGYNHKTMRKKHAYYISAPLLQHFENTTIENLDFEDFFHKCPPTEDDFVFLDPPYDTEFSTYAQNEFSKSDQERLANYLINECRGKWMMIIKYTPFIYDLYNKDGIRIKTFDKKYLVSFMNRNDKKAEHLIIMNY